MEQKYTKTVLMLALGLQLLLMCISETCQKQETSPSVDVKKGEKGECPFLLFPI